MRLTVVIEETGPGWWTATADVGREKASGDGPTEETALANLRTAVAAAWHTAAVASPAADGLR